MIFEQLFDSKSSTYTYILSSGKGREALIIDPVIENTNEYLKINWDVIYFIREVILQNTLLLDLKNLPQISPSFRMEDIKLIKNKHTDIWNKIKHTLCKKGNDYRVK